MNPTGGVYLVFYGLFIVAFTFFYVQVSFDPVQQADRSASRAGYIPGIRPGPPTENYLSKILNRITLPGSLFLAFVALTPSAILAAWHITGIPFFGTTLLISVGVALADEPADQQPADDAQLRGLPHLDGPGRACSIVLGKQGSGKGTQCVRISQHYGIPHISTGDMLRAAVKSGSALGARVQSTMEAGELVSDDIILEVMAERLARGRRAEARLRARRLPADRRPGRPA